MGVAFCRPILVNSCSKIGWGTDEMSESGTWFPVWHPKSSRSQMMPHLDCKTTLKPKNQQNHVKPHSSHPLLHLPALPRWSPSTRRCCPGARATRPATCPAARPATRPAAQRRGLARQVGKGERGGEDGEDGRSGGFGVVKLGEMEAAKAQELVW